jgi:hypothetical protein
MPGTDSGEVIGFYLTELPGTVKLREWLANCPKPKGGILSSCRPL